MNQDPVVTTENKRNLWVRFLFMLLMALAYEVTGTLVFIVTIFQLVMMLLNDAPNPRLLAFGLGLGRYLQQIVHFLTFASEEVPFPFNDWPSVD